MKAALGFKSHSGWAALVVLGVDHEGYHLLERRRIELIDEGELWAKQPYHAAEDLNSEESALVVKRGIDSARRMALQRMREVASRIRKLNHDLMGCGVLTPESMPDWNVRDILAVHFRMHKAEGVLFPDALCRAAVKCKIPLAEVREKILDQLAERALSMSARYIHDIMAHLGKAAGPPWGKDQKTAAIAAMISLAK